jgi:hypothetical protein
MELWSDYIIIRNGINLVRVLTVKYTTVEELTVILVVLNLKYTVE